MKKTPTVVAVSMPKNTPVPIECLLSAPAPGDGLLIGLAAEGIAHPAGCERRVGQSADRAKHLTGAVAWLGLAGHQRVGKPIEPLDQTGAALKLDADQTGDRDHGPVRP